MADEKTAEKTAKPEPAPKFEPCPICERTMIDGRCAHCGHGLTGTRER